MKKDNDRKMIAKKRVRGLIVFFIVVLLAVLIFDVYMLVKGWF